jgi:hypothetical protein
MRIVAHIDRDHGRTFRCSHTQTVTVCGNEECGSCNNPATVLVQGETDSMGWEPVFLCDQCLRDAEQGEDAYLAAGDVAERAPKAGHMFVVSEQTNHDGHGSWFRTFESFQQATAFYRRIRQKAERWSGLYPNQGVREWTREQIARVEQAEREEREYEWEQILVWQAEQEAEEALAPNACSVKHLQKVEA